MGRNTQWQEAGALVTHLLAHPPLLLAGSVRVDAKGESSLVSLINWPWNMVFIAA